MAGEVVVLFAVAVMASREPEGGGSRSSLPPTRSTRSLRSLRSLRLRGALGVTRFDVLLFVFGVGGTHIFFPPPPELEADAELVLVIPLGAPSINAAKLASLGGGTRPPARIVLESNKVSLPCLDIELDRDDAALPFAL